MTKRFGFTLAEVLITLGIIGVVAAMSIPTLIANTNSAKFSSQFKKSLAALNQASLMAQAQYDMDFGSAMRTATNASNLDPRTTLGGSLGGVLMGTLSGAQYYNTFANYKMPNGRENYTVPTANVTSNARFRTTPNTIVKLADGSIFAFPKAANNNCTVATGTQAQVYIPTLITSGCIGFIDVNGSSLPNREVSCREDNNRAHATAAYISGQSVCTVPRDSAHMTDIYPVVIHDGVIEPATDAARAVLGAAK